MSKKERIFIIIGLGMMVAMAITITMWKVAVGQ